MAYPATALPDDHLHPIRRRRSLCRQLATLTLFDHTQGDDFARRITDRETPPADSSETTSPAPIPCFLTPLDPARLAYPLALALWEPCVAPTSSGGGDPPCCRHGRLCGPVSIFICVLDVSLVVAIPRGRYNRHAHAISGLQRFSPAPA